jgi:hypothetical protein
MSIFHVDGIAIGFLSILHNKEAMIVIGAFLIVIGAVSAICIAYLVVQDYATGKIKFNYR